MLAPFGEDVLLLARFMQVRLVNGYIYK